jgi:hypothetical protein
MLSVKPGESILTRLTGPDHDDLSPLSDSVLHYKSFLQIDEQFFFFLHTGFEDRLADRAPESLEQELSDLIVEGQRQSERAEKYIRSVPRAPFYDQTGTNEILAVERDRYRKIFRVVVTKEDLGWVGARIAVLSMLDPTLSKSYPWHVSIEDLRAVSRLFQNDGVRFVHYLEQRLAASAETRLTQSDELDHVALYHQINSYHELPVAGVDRMSFDSSYMEHIDRYFMALSAGEVAEVPRQTMSPLLTQFVNILTRSSSRERFEIGSIILNFGADGRTTFETGLQHISNMRNEGRYLTIRLPVPDVGAGYGISVTYARHRDWDAELKLSMVHLELAGCTRWAVVKLADTPELQISDVEMLSPSRFSDAELAPYRARWEEQVQQQLAEREPGRNEKCPCASGRKFKHCHGRN